jgi:hypothetical protein
MDTAIDLDMDVLVSSKTSFQGFRCQISDVEKNCNPISDIMCCLCSHIILSPISFIQMLNKFTGGTVCKGATPLVDRKLMVAMA